MVVTCKKRVLSGGKRGQFTLFIILGLVIFFAFAFVLFAKAKIAGAQASQQADLQIKDYINKNSIDQYVTSCLDAVSDDDFMLASMQGGLLNSTDKIEYVDYVPYVDTTLNRQFNVSIAVDANIGCPDGRPSGDYIVTQLAGLYPYNCRNAKIDELPSIYMTYGDDPCHNNCTDSWSYSGFFGSNNLPVLCDEGGANAPGAGINSNYLTCDYYDYHSNSLQVKLQNKISQDIDKCVNFTEILKKTPSNITMVGNVTTTIIFSRGGFTVKLAYPFTVLMLNRQPVTRMVDFSVDKNIPFKELYDYAYELANYDVKDARFEIFNNRTQVLSQSIRRYGENIYDSSFDVKIITGDSSNNFINMVQVIDNNPSHQIRGYPLTINFAIKNRRPALDYINGGFSPLYDVLAVENSEIVLSPQGYDPDDEKNLAYAYNYWREDYVDYYNWSDTQCSNPTSLNYVLENCTKQDHSNTFQQHNWTKSQLFIDTAKDASYNTTHDDIGFHRVRIAVSDRAGLDDFQIVRILVFDSPLARINGTNFYNDSSINSSQASYEDMYILNGSESTVGVISQVLDNNKFTEFFWNDTVEPFTKTKYIYDADLMSKILLIPNDTDGVAPNVGPDFNMSNIVNFTFKQNISNLHPDPIIHNISLTVKTTFGLENTNTFYVNVTQCLPHRSDVPSYPYNPDPYNVMDSFQANHTCCSDDFEYKGTSAECFRSEKYGMERNFIDYTTATPDAPSVLPVQRYALDATGFKIPLPLGSDNDIFEQRFIRNCSGIRGNVCTGDATEDRIDVLQCDDINNITMASFSQEFSKERCSGPPQQYFDDNALPTNTPPASCALYASGTTFESLNSSGTGICTDNTAQPLCSDGHTFLAYDNSITAKYSCDGECSGDGKCNSPLHCSCNIACSAAVNIQCAGKAFGYYGSANSRSCNLAGKTYFEDYCSDCGLIDDSRRICRSGMVNALITGCSADPSCEGITAGNSINRCSPGTPFRLRCGGTCTTVFNEAVGSRIIHNQNSLIAGDGCPIVSANCYNRIEGYRINSTNYCNSNGASIKCNIGTTPTGNINNPCA